MTAGAFGIPRLSLPLGGLARAKQQTVTYPCVPGVIFTGSAGTGTTTAGRRRYYPFVIPPGAPVTLTGLSVEITTSGAAGKLIRLGCYTATRDLQPNQLITESGTLPADAAAGVQTALVSAVLPPGNYLTAWVSDGTPTYRSLPGYFLQPLNTVIGSNYAVQLFEDAGSTFGPFPYLGVPWLSPSFSTGAFPYVVFPSFLV